MWERNNCKHFSRICWNSLKKFYPQTSLILTKPIFRTIRSLKKFSQGLQILQNDHQFYVLRWVTFRICGASALRVIFKEQNMGMIKKFFRQFWEVFLNWHYHGLKNLLVQNNCWSFGNAIKKKSNFYFCPQIPRISMSRCFFLAGKIGEPS